MKLIICFTLPRWKGVIAIKVYNAKILSHPPKPQQKRNRRCFVHSAPIKKRELSLFETNSMSFLQFWNSKSTLHTNVLKSSTMLHLLWITLKERERGKELNFCGYQEQITIQEIKMSEIWRLIRIVVTVYFW